jgi:hypothetical protein
MTAIKARRIGTAAVAGRCSGIVVNYIIYRGCQYSLFSKPPVITISLCRLAPEPWLNCNPSPGPSGNLPRQEIVKSALCSQRIFLVVGALHCKVWLILRGEISVLYLVL